MIDWLLEKVLLSKIKVHCSNYLELPYPPVLNREGMADTSTTTMQLYVELKVSKYEGMSP